MQDDARDARWTELGELMRPFHVSALSTARRLSRTRDDGDDLYQEALTRAFEKLPTLRDRARFRSWFYAVLLRVHRSRQRRAFWRRFVSWEQLREEGFDLPGENGADRVEAGRGAERAATALASLSPVQREAVVLFELDGFSLEEIVAIQGASLSAVKSRLSRGRERLRQFYGQRGWSADVGGTQSSLRSGAYRTPAAANPVPAISRREGRE